MPALIKSVSFTDKYGKVYPKYNSNAGDDLQVRIDFSDCCVMLSSTQNQITYSALTGEVKISVGSWLDEGFRVGDLVAFTSYNENNNQAGSVALTIVAIPTDKIIVVTGLPNSNNAIPPDKHIWVFSVNKIKEGLEFSVNWIPNSDTSATPSMSSLIDSESQRLVLNTLNSLTITNGVGAGTYLSQVGKRSGSFDITLPRIWRFNDDLYAGANRYNFTIIIGITDFAMLFPELYQGSDCVKFVTKISMRQKLGDTKTSDLYFLDSGNTGVFNEAFNTDVSDVVTFPNSIGTLSFNKATTIPFSFVTSSTIPSIEFGACYSTIDDTYNENQNLAQNKYLKLLKSPLCDNTSAGAIFYSDYFVNDFYKITLIALNITTAGGQKTWTGTLEFDPRYSANGSFGKFIEARGSSDRQFYLWVKSGNTNSLLFGAQLSFEYPVGLPILNSENSILNHDNNTNYFSETNSSFYTNLITALDINTEDDLAFLIDFPIDTETDLSAITIDIVCRDLTTNPASEFSLERMVFDISNQTFPFFVNMFQNVSNNLPTSSEKKQAYLKFVSGASNIKTMRLYYPFLIRWEYWLKQLNATAQFVSQGKNNKDWYNYNENNLNSELYIKLGVIRDGVLDYFYQQIDLKDYDFDTNVQSDIILIDNSTGGQATSIIKGNTYTIQATHKKINGTWDDFTPPNTPYGQITVEQEESQPRWVVSTEIDADISVLNPLIGNSVKRLNETRPDSKTIIYTATFDASAISGTDYCFTSKISEQGKPNNPIFENKITEDNIDKITEDEILKQIE